MFVIVLLWSSFFPYVNVTNINIRFSPRNRISLSSNSVALWFFLRRILSVIFTLWWRPKLRIFTIHSEQHKKDFACNTKRATSSCLKKYKQHTIENNRTNQLKRIACFFYLLFLDGGEWVSGNKNNMLQPITSISSAKQICLRSKASHLPNSRILVDGLSEMDAMLWFIFKRVTGINICKSK